MPEGVNVTIDLNGYKIDRNLTAPVDNGAVIEVFGSLTVKDSSSAKTGIITGGYNTGSDGIMVAGGIQVDGGTLVLESGRITNCSSKRYGAGKISILDCTHIQRYITKLSCSDNVGKHFTI